MNEKIPVINSYQYSAVTYGENSTASVFNLPRLPKDALPQKPWNTPSKNKNFTGRQQLLNDIQERLQNSNEPLVLMACHGLGGVGKTQLARQFLEEHHAEFKGVCWFHGETLQTDYINLGNELNLFSDETLKIEERVYLVKTWLENHPGWLLIYDDVKKYEDIEDLLPTQGSGKILITSRHTEWPGEKISVDVFKLEEAREYIQTITGIKSEPEAAKQLIKALGALPLALAQACAYIKRNKKTILNYLELYQKKAYVMLENKLLPAGDKHAPVAITWGIILDQMEKVSPEVVELMYFCAYLYNENIPVYLLNDLFEKNEIRTDEAKRVSSEYSMIKWDKDKYLSLHCLVQLIIKNQLKDEKNKDLNLKKYLQKDIDILINAFNPDNKRELLPHLEALLKNIDENIDENTEVSIETKKLKKILRCLKDAYGRYDAKNQLKILERLLSIQKKLLDENTFLKYVTILKDLGNAHACLGKENGKLENFQKAIGVLEKYKADDTIEAVKIYLGLANAYEAVGEIEKSKEMLEKAEFILKKNKNDKDYFSLLISANVIRGCSYVFHSTDEEDAFYGIRILKENLIYRKNDNLNKNRQYNIAIIKYFLAVGYQKVKKYHKSEKYYNMSLETLSEDSFKDHQLAKVFLHFGSLYGDLENYRKQEECLLEALKIQKIYYEPSHKAILLTSHKLSELNQKLENLRSPVSQTEIIKRHGIFNKVSNNLPKENKVNLFKKDASFHSMHRGKRSMPCPREARVNEQNRKCFTPLLSRR